MSQGFGQGAMALQGFQPNPVNMQMLCQQPTLADPAGVSYGACSSKRLPAHCAQSAPYSRSMPATGLGCFFPSIPGRVAPAPDAAAHLAAFTQFAGASSGIFPRPIADGGKAAGKGRTRPKTPEELHFTRSDPEMGGALWLRPARLRLALSIGDDSNAVEAGNLDESRLPPLVLQPGSASIEVLCNRQSILGNPFDMKRREELRGPIIEAYSDFLEQVLSGIPVINIERLALKRGLGREHCGRDWRSLYEAGGGANGVRAAFKELRALERRKRAEGQSLRLLCHCSPKVCHVAVLARHLCNAFQEPRDQTLQADKHCQQVRNIAPTCVPPPPPPPPPPRNVQPSVHSQMSQMNGARPFHSNFVRPQFTHAPAEATSNLGASAQGDGTQFVFNGVQASLPEHVGILGTQFPFNGVEASLPEPTSNFGAFAQGDGTQSAFNGVQASLPETMSVFETFGAFAQGDGTQFAFNGIQASLPEPMGTFVASAQGDGMQFAFNGVQASLPEPMSAFGVSAQGDGTQFAFNDVQASLPGFSGKCIGTHFASEGQVGYPSVPSDIGPASAATDTSAGLETHSWNNLGTMSSDLVQPQILASEGSGCVWDAHGVYPHDLDPTAQFQRSFDIPVETCAIFEQCVDTQVAHGMHSGWNISSRSLGTGTECWQHPLGPQLPFQTQLASW